VLALAKTSWHMQQSLEACARGREYVMIQEPREIEKRSVLLFWNNSLGKTNWGPLRTALTPFMGMCSTTTSLGPPGLKFHHISYHQTGDQAISSWTNHILTIEQSVIDFLVGNAPSQGYRRNTDSYYAMWSV
jgi:hypothetical protein